ncbi:MAG: tetratricopeptide repeat protein [Chthoniobacter sp.]|uniref:O-linked N-acetylglucosamine transferase, SPINDLY family protein n=1 Tax=Chthoniobacter sp. TaxID=2510640 RepID=UPI0032A78CBA
MAAVPEALDLALRHHQAGRLAEAEALYRQILAVQPNHADALHLLGVLAQQAGRPDLAAMLIQKSLALFPGNAAAHSNLGEAFRTAGRLEEAAAAYHRALEIKPDYPEAYNNLGAALVELDRVGDAVAAYRCALQLKPDYPEAHNNLGNALRSQGLLDEALAAYRRTLHLRPDFAEAYGNLGVVLAESGQNEEAIANYRRALELNPGQAWVHGNLIYALHFLPSLDSAAIAEEHARWTRQFAEPLKALYRLPANDRSPGRRLRVGYVSPDFREHVVGRNVVPLFQFHDRENFEILCYSGTVHTDAVTAEIRQHAHQWRSTVGLTDEQFAEMIRQDGVDILVDLTQHMAGNRLAAFARKPAPVQVSFAGYPETTGVEAIEYRISDRYLEEKMEDGKSRVGSPLRTANSDRQSAAKSEAAEEEVFLIDSFWCYDPCGMEVEVNALPAQENGWVTFGSLNSIRKINEPVLKLWARVLVEVADSRLVLMSPPGSCGQRIIRILEGEGVAAHRVDFVERCPRRAYLELHHRLDLVLDPFPYGGHTTSLDALWMGVPVVSLAGRRSVSRAGLSILTNLGLAELVADSEEAYGGIAVELAGNLSRLAHLRATLRSRMEGSALMDAPRFARNIEAAYRSMWQHWCAKTFK